MDISAVVLNKLLSTGDLSILEQVKSAYFGSAYTRLLIEIKKYAETDIHQSDGSKNVLSFEGLKARVNRSDKLVELITNIENINCEDIPTQVAIDALVDKYTQGLIVKELDRYVDSLPLLNSEEMKDSLASISVKVGEETYKTSTLLDMKSIPFFVRPEEILANRTYLGLNNEFDRVTGGVAKQEYILIGGPVNSGKSITAANIFAKQYEAGNTAAFFTIEMTARETLDRLMAMLAKVSYDDIKLGRVGSRSDIEKLAKIKANMFEGGEELFLKYKKLGFNKENRFEFEKELTSKLELTPENQMIIVDDRELSIGALDLHMQLIKAKYQDNFTMAVVDYVNQIQVDGEDSMEWKTQIKISKALKNMARKYDVVMVSPYQVDKDGVARFAKGLLDSPDIALIMQNPGTEEITFKTTKIRSSTANQHFTTAIDWNTLRMYNKDSDTPTVKIDNVAKKETGSDITPGEEPF